jgi:hypothetical protein
LDAAVFLLVTLSFPAAVCAAAIASEAVNHVAAVLGASVLSVVLITMLTGVAPTAWRAEGREGYTKQIVEVFSHAFGTGPTLFFIAIGLAVGAMVGLSRKGK